MGDFECSEFVFRRQDRCFFVVAPEAIEGYLALFEFFVPGFEAGGVLMFCNRGSYVFGLDSVEVEWFAADDEVGVFGVGVE